MLAQIDFNSLFSKQGISGGKITIDQNTTLGGIINPLLPYLFVFAGLTLLLFLIYGGLQLMISEGDPQKIKSGQSKITSAIIGFVIIFSAYWIVLVVGKIFGISEVETIFKP